MLVKILQLAVYTYCRFSFYQFLQKAKVIDLTQAPKNVHGVRIIPLLNWCHCWLEVDSFTTPRVYHQTIWDPHLQRRCCKITKFCLETPPPQFGTRTSPRVDSSFRCWRGASTWCRVWTAGRPVWWSSPVSLVLPQLRSVCTPRLFWPLQPWECSPDEPVFTTCLLRSAHRKLERKNVRLKTQEKILPVFKYEFTVLERVIFFCRCLSTISSTY